jgi:hypothetical protein
MFVPREQTQEKSHKIKVVFTAFEKVMKVRYLEMALKIKMSYI